MLIPRSNLYPDRMLSAFFFLTDNLWITVHPAIFMRICKKYFFSIHIPGDRIRLPIKTIGVEAFGCIKSQIIHVLVIPDTIGVIIELHFCCILSQDFNVNFIPGIVFRRAGIGKE